MPKICLQVGHQNIKYNSIERLRGNTGAPGELEKNLRIVNRTSEILRQKGFTVKQTDANANDDPEVTRVDWQMFLACHCDANSPAVSGGFVDYADPAIDEATAESQRICHAITSEYFKHSEIVERPERRGQMNVRKYYMWRYLTAKTPCVLIEMGESIDPHDAVLLADTERIANALARGICKAFNVPFDVEPTPTPLPSPEPEEPVADIYRDAIKKIKEIVLSLPE